jgi:ribosomal protein L44E
MDLLSNQLQHLSIQQTVANPIPSLTSSITQMSDVQSVQSNNPKGNQHTKGKRKNKKGKGDKKVANNVGKGKTKKIKVKFPCMICTNDHLIHQLPWLEEAQKILAQQHPAVLTNSFPQGKNMAQASSFMSATEGS